MHFTQVVVHAKIIQITAYTKPTSLPPLSLPPGRHYVQPQWVFDCINRQRLLPTAEYSPGSVLPPHLSPFVQEGEGDYVPPERQREMREDEEGGMETGEPSHTHTHFCCSAGCVFTSVCLFRFHQMKLQYKRN